MLLHLHPSSSPHAKQIDIPAAGQRTCSKATRSGHVFFLGVALSCRGGPISAKSLKTEGREPTVGA